MSRVYFKTGSEGPTHDPYAFEEWTVQRPGKTPVKLHLGLAIWLQHMRLGTPKISFTEHEVAILAFEANIDCDFTAVVRAFTRLQNRCPHCGSKGPFTSSDGYPGETLTLCERCGAVAHCDFDRSAIE